MIQRRAGAAGISTAVCNYTFRATRITAYLKNGGTLEKAANIANHASTSTTQLYDRRNEDVSLDEIERIWKPTHRLFLFALAASASFIERARRSKRPPCRGFPDTLHCLLGARTFRHLQRRVRLSMIRLEEMRGVRLAGFMLFPDL
ncbi:hypothetical protein QN219_30230 [Sinorhizobium sp. 7-81]|uniref:hypothetical protein n=1 Tax=Sinorhizobium sp. 8-89 TaxID=3049089 RepID=UPI0024C44B49|nr:hypothetical protein [Sinorhizobium sp. 8-89]MDK1494245.1 hypothetical protein [Sinorhizobium sp. 8-89]